MKLSELSTILQSYCHEGYSLDKVVMVYHSKHLHLSSVDIKKKATSDEHIEIHLETDDDEKERNQD